MSKIVSSKILSTFSEKDKDNIAFIYSCRNEETVASLFTNPKAIESAKKGKVLFALSAEYKVDISTLTAICRERGVITSPPRERTAKPILPTMGWFKPINCDFKKLVADFLKSGRAIVEIDVNAPEFQGLKPSEIYEGFKRKHGVKITMKSKRLLLERK